MDNELITNDKKGYEGAAIKLILLTMITYMISYIGRKSWSSNINEIQSFFGVLKGPTGLVDTCFFITYALGQVFHGIFCKKYNPKWMIFLALIVSAAVNFTIAILPVDMFWLIKYIWAINGFMLASLWSLMIRVFNIYLASKHIKTSLFAMSFPVSLGYLCAYGISALFSALGNFHITFYTAAGALLVIALIWVVWVDILINKCKTERLEVDGELGDVDKKTGKDGDKPKEKVSKSFYVLFTFLAFFAIVDNLVKDGIMSWTPSMLKDTYNLENWKSVLLTIILPFFAIFGGLLSLNVSKKIKNYISLCGLFYSIVSVVLLGLIFSFKLSTWLVPLMLLVCTHVLMTGINNVITNIFPLQCEKGVNAGMVAGLIDGFCYVGSAISSYGIGTIVDKTGDWNVIFYIFVGLTVLCSVISVVSMFIGKKKKEKHIPLEELVKQEKAENE